MRQIGRRLEHVPEEGPEATQDGAPQPPGPLPSPDRSRCQACPATTASNDRPAGSHSSNGATSTSKPPRPGQVGHAGIDFDADYPAARRLELSSGDAGADAHVENVEPRAGGDDPPHPTPLG